MISEQASYPFLCGNYAPILDERYVASLDVIGEIPHELNGIYMRNGPNPQFAPLSYTYPLDGDGMIHAIYLQQGQASYRNRFVETQGLMAERRAGHALYGGVLNPIALDPKWFNNIDNPSPFKNGAFIHVIRHANQILALSESDTAYEMTEQLQTCGLWQPKAASRPINVNAHTRLCPVTGNLFLFSYQFEPPYLNYACIDAQGTLIKQVPIEKSHPSMMHDFVSTRRYLIFFDCPAVFDFNAVSSGGNLLQWRPELGVNIGILDKSTQNIFWIETEAFFVYHFANAFEKEDKIFIDYVRHSEFSLNEKKKNHPPILYRTIVDIASKTVQHQRQDDRLIEFPRINDNINSTSHRYIYAPTKTGSSNKQFNALIKYDVKNNTSIVHDFGKHYEIDEACFAPKLISQDEDDGYLMLFVYNNQENKSEFIILDAKSLTDAPVARILLPRRVPHGLHGSWMPNNL